MAWSATSSMKVSGTVGDGDARRGSGLDVDAVDADAAERDRPCSFPGIDDGLA